MPTEVGVNRHPVRGAVYGLLLGIGLAIYLILFSVIRVEIVPAIIVIVIGIVVGILWSYFAPAKKPKGYRKKDQASDEPVPEYGGVEQVVIKPYGADGGEPEA